MRPSRITWTRTPYNGWRGYLAGETGGLIEVAHVSWGSVRHDVAPWRLRTSLPGFTRESSFTSPEEAKEAAEGRLDKFLTIAGNSVGSDEA
jgi:hypothetical protein